MLNPRPLGKGSIQKEELKKDRKECRKFGPCGVGKRAIYLNSFYFDRRFYVPFRSINRVFKRVAMSKGGFSGNGIFVSIPYLVVVYDGDKEKQCIFKYEKQIDELLRYVREKHPEIQTRI